MGGVTEGTVGEERAAYPLQSSKVLGEISMKSAKVETKSRWEQSKPDKDDY